MKSLRSCSFRNPFLLLMTCLLAACAHTDQPRTNQTHAEQARDWTQLPDFTELRMELGASPEFTANCGIAGRADNRDEIVALMIEKNWVDVAKVVEARLIQCPVDIDMHMYRAIAFEELGREDDAQPHIDWYRGLLASIMASGDGRTPDTPFVTISIAEEYSLIHSFGLDVKHQSLTNDNQDMFRVVDKDGVEHWMFFYPELYWDRLTQLFRDPVDSSE